MVRNLGLIFKAIPESWPVPGEHLAVEDRPLDLDDTKLAEGGVITKNCYFSFDPYQRGCMRDASIKKHSKPYELGKPIANDSVAKVIRSSNKDFPEGDLVLGFLPAEEYTVLSAEQLKSVKLRKLNNPNNLDPKFFIASLGMPGLAAYSSFYDIGQPKKGETIFISAASGALGQMVGQLAKREGLKVIGSVGSDKKLEYIKSTLGFDEAFNYKMESPFTALPRLAPQGIDIYYENVGGEHLDAALINMNNFGRIIASGMISQYNAKDGEVFGIKNIYEVVQRRLTMRGFIVGDANMGPRYEEERQKNVQKWLMDGSLKHQLSVTKGIENSIEGLLGMFRGENFGKTLLEIADPNE